MKKFITLTVLVLLAASVRLTAAPALGAQVFIEPGQSPQQIDSWFRTLEANGFEYARIRMFGCHMQKPDGSWDFSLYDEAFNAAQRHGIKLFATLFPYTDELTDVGGFKFPRDEKHLEEVGDYIDHVVGHFKDAPALDTWVLQNEPGTGGLKVSKSKVADAMRKDWEAAHPSPERTGYLMADFSDQEYLVYFTEWYLRWIAERIMAIDPVHGRHINPHQILETIPEYDFAKYKEFLTSFGSSMHFSWHFGAFERKDYPLGVSMMTDIIGGNAQGKPYWVTEFQGGNVTASGYEVLCPTSDEVTQSIWTAIGAGVEGFMFWTLNQRIAAREAGEWGMLDFQGQPSDRLFAAAQVAKTIKANKKLFDEAVPFRSNVTILYNNESLWTQKVNAEAQKDSENEGRSKTAVMKSVASAYSAICSMGIAPQICQMAFYDWSSPKGKTIVLPDMICIPSSYVPVLRDFVKNGGKVIATGLTGYYDEYLRCAFMGEWPLKDVFGAEVSEFKAVGKYACLPAINGAELDTHLWKGYLKLAGAKPILSEGKDVLASVNRYGNGEVIWFPSSVNLGCRYRKDEALSAFYSQMVSAEAPICFASPVQDVLMRTMVSGHQVVTIMTNKGSQKVNVALQTRLGSPKVIFKSADGTVSKKEAVLSPEETVVCVWKY